jgi:hypothetical protein
MLNFKVIWLFGMPRSGTNWLSQIFDSHSNVRFKLAPLYSYALKNFVDENSPEEDWQLFYEKVYESVDEFMDQTRRRKSGEFPVFLRKNATPRFLVIKDNRHHNLADRIVNSALKPKIIYIVRHPCGAINSWLKAPKEFPKTADHQEEWRTGKCRKTGPGEFWGFDDWKYLTGKYMELSRAFPDRVHIVKYEHLVDAAKRETERIFDFAELSLDPQTTAFLEMSQKKHSASEYSVSKDKKVKDEWRQELDKNIIDEIYADLRGSILEELLYE